MPSQRRQADWRANPEQVLQPYHRARAAAKTTAGEGAAAGRGQPSRSPDALRPRPRVPLPSFAGLAGRRFASASSTGFG